VEEFGLEIWQPIQPIEVVLKVFHYFILEITKLDDYLQIENKKRACANKEEGTVGINL
jgi:hypothetical protein